MLHSVDIKGWEKNTAWCVPTCISFLTGCPLIHAQSRAAFFQNKALKDVEGVYVSEAILMLYEQGYKVEQIKLLDQYDEAPTLKAFLENRTPYQKCMPLLIIIEDKNKFSHAITAHYDYVADNHTMKPVPVLKFPHLKKYVTNAWIVSKKR